MYDTIAMQVLDSLSYLESELFYTLLTQTEPSFLYVIK